MLEEEGVETTVPIRKLEKTIKEIDAENFLVKIDNILYFNPRDISKEIKGRKVGQATIVYGSDADIGKYIRTNLPNNKLIVRI